MRTREQIEDIVKNGLVADIFRADRACALLELSGRRASELNDVERGNFGELFGAIQIALTTEAVLAVARIYDTPSTQYPTRCLRGVLNYLVKYATELPSIREPHQLELALRAREVPGALICMLEESPNDFPKLFSCYFEDQILLPDHIDALDKLKFLRDKALAHNEEVDEIQRPTFNALNKLLELSKFAVGALGWAYFNTAYSIDGEYILTQDAGRASSALSRLLDKLYK